MIAYELDQWHELFIMIGGASAALAGLLFVAVSLNLDHVLKYTYLPTIAGQTVSLLVALVIASAFALTPGQEPLALGIELLVLGVAVAAMIFIPTVRGLPAVPGDRLNWKLWRLASAVVATVPLLGAGISLIAGVGGGMFWVLAWSITALVVSSYNAWVLLIEIRR